MARRPVNLSRWIGPSVALALFSLLAAPPSCRGLMPPQTKTSQQQARIQKKGQEIEEKVKDYLAAGGDPQKIGPLGQQVDEYLKAGKMDEAEETMDKILAIVRKAPAGEPERSRRGETTEPPSVGLGRGGPNLGSARSVRLARIPSNAEIIYHRDGLIYCMDADGRNSTQITFNSRHYEHVAASFDHRHVVANSWAEGSGETSRIFVFDLERGTEIQLVPSFKMAGNGGVVIDKNGYVYFAGVDRPPYASPRRREEFMANGGANDIYRVKLDGTGLQRLTNTRERGEVDVSVSLDGTLITYMATKIDPPNDPTEIWVRNADGTNPRLLYTSGKVRVSSVHDPEISPDNTKVIFSKVNSAYRNFRSDPNADTAHDIWEINMDGTGLTRLTPPGPISIIPCWKGSRILYLELSDQGGGYKGITVMNSDGTGRKRIKDGANIARWIP